MGEASESELAGIGIKPGEYPSVSTAHVQWVLATTEGLFGKYRHTVPEPWDRKKVFVLAPTPEMADVLDYAFEQAAIAGKVSDWRYIEGIMSRLSARGICTAAEARAFDAERPDMEDDT